MEATREEIEAEIQWFNHQVFEVKEKMSKWLEELGHHMSFQEKEITKIEEASGPYKARQFDILIDSTMTISLIPYAIWIIGAKGRIDIKGPSGIEKLVFFFPGGPGITTEIRDGGGNVINKSIHGFFSTIDEAGWYWYDDSSYRKVSKFSKEIIEPLLERLQ